MLFVGLLLVSGLALVAVESVGYSRGGYDSAFWKLPLDDKLDHVVDHRWEWWWISIWELVGLFLMTAGMFGLAGLLGEAGSTTIHLVALGGYLIAAFAWVFGLIVQSASVSQAASQRSESGRTPSWIHPFWQAGYLAEGVWIVGANLAYTLIGLSILQTGLVAGWAGWSVVVGSGLIAVLVPITRGGFPQLAVLAPAVIGIAAIIEAS
jgi:hypothetical protein